MLVILDNSLVVIPVEEITFIEFFKRDLARDGRDVNIPIGFNNNNINLNKLELEIFLKFLTIPVKADTPIPLWDLKSKPNIC